MNTDEAQLLLQSIRAICVATTESVTELNEELGAALVWGIGHLAQEAYKHLDGEIIERDSANGSYIHLNGKV
jgi:hypothetical protein